MAIGSELSHATAQNGRLRALSLIFVLWLPGGMAGVGCARVVHLPAQDTGSDDGASPDDMRSEGDSTASPVDASPPADIGQRCDDDDPCTHSDHIEGSSCVGVAYSCDDHDPCTEDSCRGDGTCALIPVAECTIGYAISAAQPSAAISSSSNLIKLSRVVRRANGGLSLVLISDMGSFTNLPQYWNTTYDYNDPPPLCYDYLAMNSGTIFEGLTQNIYPAPSASALVQKIRDSLSDPYTFRWPSNASGGNLCTSGNWWTVVTFTSAGADHVDSLLQGQ